MNALQLAVVSVLAVGVGALVAFRRLRRLQWGLFFAAAVLFVGVAALIFGQWDVGWQLDLGSLSIGLTNTPLGWVFFAFSSVLTLFIALFSLSYNDEAHNTGIAPLWMILLASTVGIFFAADWIAFVIGWEIMGWTSFFIIAHGKERSYRASIYYYTLSLVGTATLLAAVFVVWRFTGTLSLDASIAGLAALWESQPGVVYTVAILLTVTFFTKSALGPFYMWPAKAHAEAPDDFSSFLSGVMIKYGLFAFVRILMPVFGPGYVGPTVLGTPFFLYVLGWVGALTAVWGTLLAVRENDMKRLMAYSTVSNMGYVLVALSVNTVFGVAAAIFHVVNHMFFKGTIFLSLAAVKYRTGERAMHRLGGIAYRMPVAFFAFLIGIIAAAGIPPMSGFASKWMIFQSLFGRDMLLLAVPVFFASTASFLYLYRGLHSIYLGQLSPRFAHVRPAPLLQSAAMIVLMLSVYAVGTFPGIALVPVQAALQGVAGQIGAVGTAADVPVTLSAIVGTTSSINLTVVSVIFLSSFVLVLILYVVGKRRAHVEPLDTYTAGEDPADWNMSPEQYHYAYHFYEPFEKLTGPMLDHLSMETVFERIRRGVARFAGVAGRWLDGSGAGVALSLVALLVILMVGVAV